MKEDMVASLEAQIHECCEKLDAKRKEVSVEEGRMKRGKFELEPLMQSVTKKLHTACSHETRACFNPKIQRGELKGSCSERAAFSNSGEVSGRIIC